MTSELNDFQKQLLKILQQPLPICREPFISIAQNLNSDRNTLLDSIKVLTDSGLIRRFGPHISYRALGKTASLVAAHVPDEDISITSAVVNAIPDFHQDRLVGKRNIVVRVGRYNGVLVYLALSLLGLTVPVLGAALGLFPKWTALTLGALPF